MTTAVLGQLVSGLAGGRQKPGDFAPYYKPDRAHDHSNLRAAFEFIRRVKTNEQPRGVGASDPPPANDGGG